MPEVTLAVLKERLQSAADRIARVEGSSVDDRKTYLQAHSDLVQTVTALATQFSDHLKAHDNELKTMRFIVTITVAALSVLAAFIALFHL